MRTKLKIFRITRKFNQHQMAASIGYERAYYGHVERGYQGGSAAFWKRLQQAFGLTDNEVQELKEVE
ncbi:MAG: helix-turn-helix domain-containing protein [Clostridia bacterium]|nr:helix-turn-helix domain-containing protein [Clostridia bacterium]